MMVWQQWRCGSILGCSRLLPGHSPVVFFHRQQVDGGEDNPPASLEGTPGFSHSPTISSSSSYLYFKRRRRRGRENCCATNVSQDFLLHPQEDFFTCWQEQQRYRNKRKKKHLWNYKKKINVGRNFCFSIFLKKTARTNYFALSSFTDVVVVVSIRK